MKKRSDDLTKYQTLSFNAEMVLMWSEDFLYHLINLIYHSSYMGSQGDKYQNWLCFELLYFYERKDGYYTTTYQDLRFNSKYFFVTWFTKLNVKFAVDFFYCNTSSYGNYIFEVTLLAGKLIFTCEKRWWHNYRPYRLK